MRIYRYLFLATFLAASLAAQTEHRRATLSGGGSDADGRCTFEVFVDGGADVELHGDQGDLVTTSGSAAHWRRLECTSVLPSHPANFQFRGIDGRGSQRMTRDPNASGGVVVIHIDDPQGGAEGYTGEISWRGGRDNFGGVGNWGAGTQVPRSDDRRPPDGDRRPDGDRPREWEHRITPADAMNICRNQVMETRNVPRTSVTVRPAPAQDDRTLNVRFSYVNGYGRTKTGSCSVSPTGQILDFHSDDAPGADRDRERTRTSWNQALVLCQQEAAKRFSVGIDDVRAQHGADPGNGNYLINYQAQMRDGRIQTGSCRVSGYGEIEDFRRW